MDGWIDPINGSKPGVKVYGETGGETLKMFTNTLKSLCVMKDEVDE